MEKFKVDIDNKELSKERINSKKDFDKFYSSYAKRVKPFYKKGWFLGSTGFASVAAIVIAMSLADAPEDKKQFVEVIPNQTVSAQEAGPNNNQVSQVEPFVNPPLKKLNVVWETFNVDAAKGIEITNKRGSKIKIPANSFKDQKGNIVEGTVEVKYREFIDQVDIFVSGIPMKYDSAGVEYTFESAGMMEILAEKDGEKVNVAPGKNIDIEMRSDYSSTEYNLYKLAPEKRKWDCLGKDKVVKKNEAPKEEGNKKVDVELPMGEDKRTIKELADLPEYERANQKRIQIRNDIQKLQAQAPAKPIKAEDDKVKFDIEYEKKEFPELAVYEGVSFQILDTEILNPSDAEKTWNDVSFKKTDKKEVYKIKFSNLQTNEAISYLAKPVFEGHNYENAKANFDELFADYNKKLNTLKKEQGSNRNLIESIKKRWGVSQQQIANAHLNASVNNLVYRTFQIASLGIYNCDTPKKGQRNDYANLNSLTIDGKLAAYGSIKHINKKKNTVYRESLSDARKFLFNRKHPNIILMVNNGEILWMDEAAVRGLKREGDFNFVSLGAEIGSAEELKEKLNF